MSKIVKPLSISLAWVIMLLGVNFSVSKLPKLPSALEVVKEAPYGQLENMASVAFSSMVKEEKARVISERSK